MYGGKHKKTSVRRNILDNKGQVFLNWGRGFSGKTPSPIQKCGMIKWNVDKWR